MSEKSMLDIAKERFVSFETERAKAAALIAIAEQAKRIADALNSIDGVLVNARGQDGAIKVDAWTYDARRELG